MDFFEKITEKPGKDLLWNIPERKQGKVNIIGGNGQNFRTPVKTAEFLGAALITPLFYNLSPEVCTGLVLFRSFF